MSIGADNLLSLLKEIFPFQKILLEYHIGGGLRLDYFLPNLNIAFEYNGRPHYVYSEHFHKNKQGFLDSKRRDFKKIELCQQNKINLIIVRFDEKLTKQLILDKLKENA